MAGPQELIAAFKALSFESVDDRLEGLRLLASMSLDYTEDRMNPKEGVVQVHCCSPDIARRCILSIHDIYKETPPDMDLVVKFGVDTDFGQEINDPKEQELGDPKEQNEIEGLEES